MLQHMQRGRSGRWKECRCKCIELKTEPTLSELSGQLRRIAQALPALVQHDGDLDMEFQDGALQRAWGVAARVARAARAARAAGQLLSCGGCSGGRDLGKSC